MTAVLLKTDGTYEVVKTKKPAELLRGNVTMLPQKKGAACCAYALDDAMTEQLPTNEWSRFLDSIGFVIPWMLGGVWGNVVLYGAGVSATLLERIKAHQAGESESESESEEGSSDDDDEPASASSSAGASGGGAEPPRKEMKII
jgi:hypothetical protein